MMLWLQIIAWTLLVLLGACVLCFLSRTITEKFQEVQYESTLAKQLLEISLNRIASSRGLITSSKTVQVQGYEKTREWHRWTVQACFLQPPLNTGFCALLYFRVRENWKVPPFQWEIVMERPMHVVQKTAPSERVLLPKGIGYSSNSSAVPRPPIPDPVSKSSFE